MTVEGLGGRKVIVDMAMPEVRKQVEIFGKYCATQEEMADYFDCSLSTIEKYMTEKDPENVSEFLRVYKKESSNTKLSLRSLQLQKAKGGDTAMLIWVGKQLLGQREKHENTNYNMTPTVIKDDL